MTTIVKRWRKNIEQQVLAQAEQERAAKAQQVAAQDASAQRVAQARTVQTAQEAAQIAKADEFRAMGPRRTTGVPAPSAMGMQYRNALNAPPPAPFTRQTLGQIDAQRATNGSLTYNQPVAPAAAPAAPQMTIGQLDQMRAQQGYLGAMPPVNIQQ